MTVTLDALCAIVIDLAKSQMRCVVGCERVDALRKARSSVGNGGLEALLVSDLEG